MKKKEIKELINSLNFPREEFYILSGSCMVLYGLRDIANDLDLCISEELFKRIKKDFLTNEAIPNEYGFYKISDNIEVVVNKREEFIFDVVDGYQVEPLQKILEWKIKQNKDKDLIDIQKIQAYQSFCKISTPYLLNEYMRNSIKYNWMDKNGKKRDDYNSDMYNVYSLMSPIEVLIKKYGICMDQVELERLWFKIKNFDFKTICIQLKRKNSNPGHVFLVYRDEDDWYWFENAWYDMRGIHKYQSLDSCFYDIKQKFIIQNRILDSEMQNLEMYEYGEYPSNISYEEMDKYDSENKNRKYIEVVE